MPIEVERLTHIYAPNTPFQSVALSEISFSIADGAFAGLIGHTGSGKTTLIQHLNGLLRPTSGRIVIDGLNLGHKSTDLREVRRRVGMVFQYPEYQLFEETVLADVMFGPKNLGASPDEAAERAKEALALVGLNDETVWKKSPFELSGGQKRRAAIAGVLAMRPKVLVMDEPAAGLDPRGREEIMALITGIHAAGGVTMIMVSHSMSDVARYCDQILVMNRGRLAYSGTPGQVFEQRELLRSIGLDLPPSAQLKDALRERGFGIPEDANDLDALRRAILAEFSPGGDRA